MPTLAENRRIWSQYDWPEAGDEWSSPWGSVALEWAHTIYPRIVGFLPARTILEIAPGYGRWTQYLLRFCDRLYGVEIAERCVEECRRRFANHPTATFHLNDGTSLAAVPDESIDFAFSFDSLVHAEADVIEGYLNELGRKLAVGGVGFIHHSNLAACSEVRDTHVRAPSMSALLFCEMCGRAGLHCTAQETINWRQEKMIDCFSAFRRPRQGETLTRPVLRYNPLFHLEIDNAHWLSRLYAPRGS